MFRPSRQGNADIRQAWSDFFLAALGGKSVTPVKWTPQTHLIELSADW
jgi:hypothetical protein